MYTIFTFISFVPVLILVIGSFFILSIDKNKNLKKDNYYLLYVILLSFSTNSIFFILNLFIKLNQETLEVGYYFITEILLFLGLLISIFSTKEKETVPKRNIFEAVFLIFLSALIGFTISENVISIISWFLLALFIVVVIFYFGDYPKDLKLLKRFYIVLVMSIVFLTISIFLILCAYGTLDSSHFNLSEVSVPIKVIISLCLIVGLGIPCGFFPFASFHLKNYFQESSYTNLFLFSLFSFANLFLIIKMMILFSFSFIISGLLILIFSFLGLLLSSISLLSIIFYPSENNAYSIKKMVGFSQISDFNMILFHLSFYLLTSPLAIGYSYLNFILFYTILVFLTKTLFLYSLFPAMLETFNDNLKKFGNFWSNYRIYGILNYLSGIIISVPLSFVFIKVSLWIFTTPGIYSNSLYAFLVSFSFSVNVFWVILSLLFISLCYVQMYSKKAPQYIKREIKPFNIKPYAFPVFFIVILIGILLFFYFFSVNIYLNIFDSFLLFAD